MITFPQWHMWPTKVTSGGRSLWNETQLLLWVQMWSVLYRTRVDQNLLFAKRFRHWLTLNPLALTNIPEIIHIIHLYNIFTCPFSVTHGENTMLKMSSLSPWRSTVVSYVFSCVFTTVLTDWPVFWCYGMGLVTW